MLGVTAEPPGLIRDWRATTSTSSFGLTFPESSLFHLDHRYQLAVLKHRRSFLDQTASVHV